MGTRSSKGSPRIVARFGDHGRTVLAEVRLKRVKRLLGHYLEHHADLTAGEFVADFFGEMTITLEGRDDDGERRAA